MSDTEWQREKILYLPASVSDSMRGLHVPGVLFDFSFGQLLETSRDSLSCQLLFLASHLLWVIAMM